MRLAAALVLGLTLPVLASPALAQDALVTMKTMSPEIALELARATLADCRKRGYQVAVAVVDRSGLTQVLLRDRFAGPHTVPTATGKAWTAVTFKTSTLELAGASKAGRRMSGLRGLPGVVAIGGGLVVEAGGALVGGIGVSGAPGGEADEACASAGLEAVREKLEFAARRLTHAGCCGTCPDRQWRARCRLDTVGATLRNPHDPPTCFAPRSRLPLCSFPVRGVPTSRAPSPTPRPTSSSRVSNIGW